MDTDSSFTLTITVHPIYVEKDRSTAKFNLKNIELVKSRHFNAKEIGEIRKLVLKNSELFKSKWDEYFNGN